MTALSVIEQQAVETAAPREVLTCRLGAEAYAIDILAVQEIRRQEPATRIANAPAHVLGVMNLRGVIVPIVVNVGHRTVGLVVDAVSDVVALGAEQIQPRPSLGRQVAADFIVGLAQVEGAEGQRLLQLVDLSALLRHL
ncbi:MAG: chemotaxis protein CheW [Proteobacteria bacterium]|nr:chemotaxis protein CheW [Pseudomonadota bacterium]